jgi:hypothetical protein
VQQELTVEQLRERIESLRKAVGRGRPTAEQKAEAKFLAEQAPGAQWAEKPPRAKREKLWGGKAKKAKLAVLEDIQNRPTYVPPPPPPKIAGAPPERLPAARIQEGTPDERIVPEPPPMPQPLESSAAGGVVKGGGLAVSPVVTPGRQPQDKQERFVPEGTVLYRKKTVDDGVEDVVTVTAGDLGHSASNPIFTPKDIIRIKDTKTAADKKAVIQEILDAHAARRAAVAPPARTPSQATPATIVETEGVQQVTGAGTEMTAQELDGIEARINELEDMLLDETASDYDRAVIEHQVQQAVVRGIEAMRPERLANEANAAMRTQETARRALFDIGGLLPQALRDRLVLASLGRLNPAAPELTEVVPGSPINQAAYDAMMEGSKEKLSYRMAQTAIRAWYARIIQRTNRPAAAYAFKRLTEMYGVAPKPSHVEHVAHAMSRQKADNDLSELALANGISVITSVKDTGKGVTPVEVRTLNTRELMNRIASKIATREDVVKLDGHLAKLEEPTVLSPDAIIDQADLATDAGLSLALAQILERQGMPRNALNSSVNSLLEGVNAGEEMLRKKLAEAVAALPEGADSAQRSAALDAAANKAMFGKGAGEPVTVRLAVIKSDKTQNRQWVEQEDAKAELFDAPFSWSPVVAEYNQLHGELADIYRAVYNGITAEQIAAYEAAVEKAATAALTASQDAKKQFDIELAAAQKKPEGVKRQKALDAVQAKIAASALKVGKATESIELQRGVLTAMKRMARLKAPASRLSVLSNNRATAAMKPLEAKLKRLDALNTVLRSVMVTANIKRFKAMLDSRGVNERRTILKMFVNSKERATDAMAKEIADAFGVGVLVDPHDLGNVKDVQVARYEDGSFGFVRRDTKNRGLYQPLARDFTRRTESLVRAVDNALKPGTTATAEAVARLSREGEVLRGWRTTSPMEVINTLYENAPTTRAAEDIRKQLMFAERMGLKGTSRKDVLRDVGPENLATNAEREDDFAERTDRDDSAVSIEDAPEDETVETVAPKGSSPRAAGKKAAADRKLAAETEAARIMEEAKAAAAEAKVAAREEVLAKARKKAEDILRAHDEVDAQWNLTERHAQYPTPSELGISDYDAMVVLKAFREADQRAAEAVAKAGGSPVVATGPHLDIEKFGQFMAYLNGEARIKSSTNEILAAYAKRKKPAPAREVVEAQVRARRAEGRGVSWTWESRVLVDSSNGDGWGSERKVMSANLYKKILSEVFGVTDPDQRLEDFKTTRAVYLQDPARYRVNTGTGGKETISGFNIAHGEGDRLIVSRRFHLKRGRAGGHYPSAVTGVSDEHQAMSHRAMTDMAASLARVGAEAGRTSGATKALPPGVEAAYDAMNRVFKSTYVDGPTAAHEIFHHIFEHAMPVPTGADADALIDIATTTYPTDPAAWTASEGVALLGERLFNEGWDAVRAAHPAALDWFENSVPVPLRGVVDGIVTMGQKHKAALLADPAAGMRAEITTVEQARERRSERHREFPKIDRDLWSVEGGKSLYRWLAHHLSSRSDTIGRVLRGLMPDTITQANDPTLNKKREFAAGGIADDVVWNGWEVNKRRVGPSMLDIFDLIHALGLDTDETGMKNLDGAMVLIAKLDRSPNMRNELTRQTGINIEVMLPWSPLTPGESADYPVRDTEVAAARWLQSKADRSGSLTDAPFIQVMNEITRFYTAMDLWRMEQGTLSKKQYDANRTRTFYVPIKTELEGTKDAATVGSSDEVISPLQYGFEKAGLAVQRGLRNSTRNAFARTFMLDAQTKTGAAALTGPDVSPFFVYHPSTDISAEGVAAALKITDPDQEVKSDVVSFRLDEDTARLALETGREDMKPGETMEAAVARLIGAPVEMRIRDGVLRKALVHQEIPAVPWFLRPLAATTRLFNRLNTTFAPTYVFKTFVRDPLNLLIQSELPEMSERFKAMARHYKGLMASWHMHNPKAAAQWKADVSQFMAAGASGTLLATTDSRAAMLTHGVASPVIARYLDERIGASRHGTFKHFWRAWDGWQRIVHTGEQALRMTEFHSVLNYKLRKHAEKLGVPVTAIPPADIKTFERQAALAARNIGVPFGDYGTLVAGINTVVPFFGASVKGSEMVLRSVMGFNGSGEWTGRRALNAWGAIAGLAALKAIIAGMFDDEERKKYEELPLEQRARGIHMPVRNDRNGEVGFVTIPMPPGLFSLAADYLASFFMEKPDSLRDFMAEAGTQIMPDVPPLIDAIMVATVDTSWRKGDMRAAVPRALGKLPEMAQYNEKTGIIAQQLAGALNSAAMSAFGADTDIQLSPAKLDFMFNSYLGGLNWTLRKMDPHLRKVMEPASTRSVYDESDIPLVDAFLTGDPGFGARTIQRFYDATKRAQEMAGRVEALRARVRSGELSEAAYNKLKAESPELRAGEASVKMLGDIKAVVGEARKHLDRVEASPHRSIEDKMRVHRQEMQRILRLADKYGNIWMTRKAGQ